MTLTAETQRRHAKETYNAYLADCPARQVLEVFTTKWTTLILYQLSHQPLRHSQLRTRIQGASQKMLTSTLRSLERDGLISREVKQAMPPHVEYSLTPLGVGLIPILDTMKAWAGSHFDQVVQSRQDYDFG